MVLHGEAAVGLLELVVGGAAADGEHLVVVHPHRRRVPAGVLAARELLLLLFLKRRFFGIGWWFAIRVYLPDFNDLRSLFLPIYYFKV